MLRPYQEAAITAIQNGYDKGVRRHLIVMPTGSGKTRVFAHLYEALRSRLGGQTLALAAREELIDQSIKTFKEVNPTLVVDKEMAGYKADPTADIVVASVATLGRKGTTRIDGFNWDNFKTVIIDEAHHSTAESYKRIFDACGVLSPGSEKLLVGVTATPGRSDGVALSDIYEQVSYSYPIRSAIKDGWLAEPRGYRIMTNTSLDGLKISDGDFQTTELASRVNNPERNQIIVSSWKKYAENRRTIIFAVDIQHAKDLADKFVESGVLAKAVWGDDPDRKQKLEEHQNGKFQVLVNVGIALEGYDDPHIACVVLARPTESSLVYQQAVGRGLRLAGGKSDCLVLDPVDNGTRHSLITLPTLMGLKNVLDLKGKSLLWAVETLEKLQAENPSVNFDKLTDIDGAKVLIEAVDMFQIRFPAEVEANSQLTWFRAIDGGYKMLIPKETDKIGNVRIFENALGRWQILGEINSETFHGTRPTMEECFKVADEQIRKRVSPMTLSCVKREATWHKNKVTDGQKKMLGRLFPHKKFDFSLMNSGDASRVIAERLSKKA